MNVRDAEQLIKAHRRGRRADGSVEKAVALAEGDVVLQRKLESQRAFDDHVVGVIRCIQPAGNLRERLANLPASAAGKPRFGLAAMLPVFCGGFILLGILAFVRMEAARSFTGRDAVDRMIDSSAKVNVSEFERVAKPAGELSDWFYMRGFDSYAVPAEIRALPVSFARVAKGDGRVAAQMAVEERGMLVHVFRPGDFGVEVASDQPWRVFEREGWAAAIRNHAGLCVLLMFRGPASEMEKFVKSLKG